MLSTLGRSASCQACSYLGRGERKTIGLPSPRRSLRGDASSTGLGDRGHSHIFSHYEVPKARRTARSGTAAASPLQSGHQRAGVLVFVRWQTPDHGEEHYDATSPEAKVDRQADVVEAA